MSFYQTIIKSPDEQRWEPAKLPKRVVGIDNSKGNRLQSHYHKPNILANTGKGKEQYYIATTDK